MITKDVLISMRRYRCIYYHSVKFAAMHDYAEDGNLSEQRCGDVKVTNVFLDREVKTIYI